jgi:hypothetical protein
MLKFSMSASCRISFFLVWLLIGREDLEGGEIKDSEIEGDGIGDSEENIGIADCEKYFLKYVNRCAVSVYSANLIINRVTIEIANTY